MKKSVKYIAYYFDEVFDRCETVIGEAIGILFSNYRHEEWFIVLVKSKINYCLKSFSDQEKAIIAMMNILLRVKNQRSKI